MASYFSSGCVPFVPWLERYEKKAAVGIGDTAEHAVANNRGDVCHPRGLHHNLLNLAADFTGALQRGGVGQLHPGIEISLVLLRQEAAGESTSYKAGEPRHQDQKEQAHSRFSDKSPAPPDIAVGGAAEGVVEPAIEAA